MPEEAKVMKILGLMVPEVIIFVVLVCGLYIYGCFQ
jgi:hypothetical protein